MLQLPITERREGVSSRVDGALFLFLALFSGLAGGFLGLVSQNAGSVHALSHGLLLDLFVLIPAFLGGMGRLLSPDELTASPSLMSLFDRAALGVLVVGVLAALSGPSHPALFAVALVLWCMGVTLLALSTVVTCLECRPGRFRDLAPFTWSQLLVSLGLIVMVPVLLAGVAHDLIAGHTGLDTVQFWLRQIQVPILALVVLLALGAIASLVSFDSTRLKITLPFLMTLSSLGVSVVWAHNLVVPGLSDGWLLGMGVALPDFAIMGLICVSLWRRSFVMSYALSWSFPALLLLSAGWVFCLFPLRPEVFHSAMLFGAVFALLGGYYRWQAQNSDIVAPLWLGRIHLVAMGFAVLAMIPFLPLLRHVGEVGMLVSLGCVATLGARLLLPIRSAMKADLS